MHHALGMLHFEEQLFTEVCSTKHAHYLLGVGDKVGEPCQMQTCGFLRGIQNLANMVDQFVLSSQSTSKGKEKISKVGWKAAWMGLAVLMWPMDHRLGTHALDDLKQHITASVSTVDENILNWLPPWYMPCDLQCTSNTCKLQQ